MIISHRHQFIFIKTHKTAGSSLEMGLGELCGPDDIISSMETNDASGIPRNFHGTRLLGRLYARSKFLRKLVNRHSRLVEPWYYEHMPAWRIRQQVGDNVWNSYYKFCFERNPWDKVVSYYLWKKHGQGKALPDFEKYVMTKTHRLPMDAGLYIDDEGQPMVDHVYDFHHLKEEVASLYDRLGLKVEASLPREKTGIKADRKPYQEYYTERTRDKVAEVFSREIALLGYTF